MSGYNVQTKFKICDTVWPVIRQNVSGWATCPTCGLQHRDKAQPDKRAWTVGNSLYVVGVTVTFFSLKDPPEIVYEGEADENNNWSHCRDVDASSSREEAEALAEYRNAIGFKLGENDW